MTSVLEISGLAKSFGGVRAVDDLSFSVQQGSVSGLMGPNGAGKTSVVNLITGFYHPDAGTVLFEGSDISGLKPNVVSRAGITRTYQNVRLFSGLNVLEQVVAGMYSHRPVSSLRSLVFSRAERADRAAALERADALLARVGVTERDELADKLPYGVQRRVELARALATEPSLVLLDEPTAGMNPEESQEIGELMTSLAEEGRTILVIEHNMRLILDFCDQAFVMSFGRLIKEGTPSECVDDPEVQHVYFGKGTDAAGIPAPR